MSIDGSLSEDCDSGLLEQHSGVLPRFRRAVEIGNGIGKKDCIPVRVMMALPLGAGSVCY